MSRIVCVWELGEGLGHIGNFSAVINELIARGHEVLFICQDLSRVSEFFSETNVRFLQAPVWLHRLKRPMVTQCYAEILLYKGYQSEETLRPLVDAWMNIFMAINPDLLIFDHSPTALLASRKLSIPKIIYSNSYITPSKGSGVTSLRPWDNEYPQTMEKHDCHVIDIINRVSNRFSLPPIEKMSDLFDVDKVILSGFFDLDLYRDIRRDAIYLGAIRPPASRDLQKASWQENQGINIFAYVKYGMENVDQVIDIFSRLPVNVICFYSGAKPETYQHYQSSHMLISHRPFDLEDVLSNTHIVVCHAGMGMVSVAMAKGCPMVLLPTQLEQFHTAHRLHEMQLAVIVNNKDSTAVIEEKISRVINQPDYFNRAQLFAETHRTVSSVDKVCDICDDLCTVAG